MPCDDDGETVTDVVYSSTDPSVATVDANGKVTAVGAPSNATRG